MPPMSRSAIWKRTQDKLPDPLFPAKLSAEANNIYHAWIMTLATTPPSKMDVVKEACAEFWKNLIAFQPDLVNKP